MADNIREIALDALLQLEQQREYSNKLIRAVLNKYNFLDNRDKSFIKRLTEGTLERRIELDYYLNYASTVPVRKMKPLIRCLLRMSLYQLLYMDTVPDSAVCNEACKLAEKRGFGGLRSFVNGTLRRLAREKDSLPLPDKDREPTRYLSVKYSMPDWIVELWVDEYGVGIAETILENLIRVYPVSLRFRTDLAESERQALCAEIEQTGAQLTPSGYLPYVYTMTAGGSVDSLPGFREGRYTVQDISSALAVEAAGIGSGDLVLDACAAPGGKSLLAAEKAGTVISRDMYEGKVGLIREAAERMKADNIETQVWDAKTSDAGLQGRADVVLLDVPCSGLGVMGKKRDIKYRMNRETLRNIERLQRTIVDTCCGYVKPGGVLVYSTCTINARENEEMVRHIARDLPFEPAPLEEVLPEVVLRHRERLEEDRREKGKTCWVDLNEQERSACIQMLPGYMEGDGFFMARFRRKQD